MLCFCQEEVGTEQQQRPPQNASQQSCTVEWLRSMGSKSMHVQKGQTCWLSGVSHSYLVTFPFWCIAQSSSWHLPALSMQREYHETKMEILRPACQSRVCPCTCFRMGQVPFIKKSQYGINTRTTQTQVLKSCHFSLVFCNLKGVRQIFFLKTFTGKKKKKSPQYCILCSFIPKPIYTAKLETPKKALMPLPTLQYEAGE